MMALLRRIFFILFVGLVILLVAAQIASSFFLKPILEREGRRIFQAPIYMDRAGANLFGASFWMKGVRIKNAKGFQEQDFLTARTISVDFNLLSLLTNEFVIEQILLKDPHFNFEMNEQGQWNALPLGNRARDRFEQWMQRKPKFLRLVRSYTLEKFALRNGTVQFIDRHKPERNLDLQSISFSLARIVYPPDPEEALPTAIYINATAPMPEAQEAKILVIGRLNPFVPKKSFDITGSAKGLALSRYGGLLPDFPLDFAAGTLQLKIKALCHENQVDIHHQVRIEGLKFRIKEIPNQKPSLVFGLTPESVTHFFNDLQPLTVPFEFDFHVVGDLGDPQFNVLSNMEKKIREVIYDRVTTQAGTVNQAIKASGPTGRPLDLRSEEARKNVKQEGL